MLRAVSLRDLAKYNFIREKGLGQTYLRQKQASVAKEDTEDD